jgi:phosphoglycolate phosphatase
MLLIFDWDGTLSDSASRIVHCVQKAALSTGYEPLPDEKIRNIIGLGLVEAMHRLYPNLNESEKERIKQSYIQYFVELDQTPSAFFSGVVEGLELLRRESFQLAVATGKSRKGLDRVLTNLNMTDFFDDTRCADETASKPHPLMLQELLQRFGKSPQQAIMIGDTEYDMEMAQTVGVSRVAVSYGAHHIDRLHAYKPVLAVDHFSEFVDWVIKAYRPADKAQ